jgi:hypothetical protein
MTEKNYQNTVLLRAKVTPESGGDTAFLVVNEETGALLTEGSTASALPSSYTSTSTLDNKLTVSASAKTFQGFVGVNTKTSTQYILAFDSATVPIDGTVPDFVCIAQPLSNFFLNLGDGVEFTNGITLCNSSTLATKTIGSADCFFTGVYK